MLCSALIYNVKEFILYKVLYFSICIKCKFMHFYIDAHSSFHACVCCEIKLLHMHSLQTSSKRHSPADCHPLPSTLQSLFHSLADKPFYVEVCAVNSPPHKYGIFRALDL